MEQLLTLSTVGFIISIIAAIAGAVLSAITFLKFDIRQIFMIRSGRGLKNALIGMEKQRAETGTLRNASLEAPEKKSTKKKGQKKTDRKFTAHETFPLRSAPETVPLRTAEETMPLDSSVAEQHVSEEQQAPPLTGERAAFEMIFEDVETHTDEEINAG